MPLTPEQIKRLDECVKDEFGQPLPCYGCMSSAAPYEEMPEDVKFPGINVEWNCLHCIRNPHREAYWKEQDGAHREEEARRAMGIVADGPIDLYCAYEAHKQNIFRKI